VAPEGLLSGVDRMIAMALALIWIGATLIGLWVGSRHELRAVLIIGPLGLWYGVLWARGCGPQPKHQRLDRAPQETLDRAFAGSLTKVRNPSPIYDQVLSLNVIDT
jgi:hypothetical protein